MFILPFDLMLMDMGLGFRHKSPLHISRMPIDERSSRQARRDLAGIIVFISRDPNEAWREKIRQMAF
jgi:hypothetical protein